MSDAMDDAEAGFFDGRYHLEFWGLPHLPNYERVDVKIPEIVHRREDGTWPERPHHGNEGVLFIDNTRRHDDLDYLLGPRAQDMKSEDLKGWLTPPGEIYNPYDGPLPVPLPEIKVRRGGIKFHTPENPMTRKDPDAELEAAEKDAKRALARLTAAAKAVGIAPPKPTYPEEPVELTVIRFSLQHEERGIVYDYAGLRAANGRWWVTGSNGRKLGWEWPNLIDWMRKAHKAYPIITFRPDADYPMIKI